jgi:cytochrome c oxidase subunit 2
MCNRMPFLGKGLSVCITSFLLLFAAQAKSAEQIENPGDGWDHLWYEVVVDITIIGIIFSLITLYLMFKYRRREPNQEGKPPKLSTAMAVGWAVIPAFIFMADDLYLAAKGWQLWNNYRQVPADRMEIQLESGMYSWDYTYPNGVQTQNKLVVPAGKPIMLRMTSRDTLHSHYIPDFRVKEDSMPGRVTYLWFYPKEPGEHLVSCAEYCGIMHSYMVGKVIVLPVDKFKQWYDGEAAKLAKTDVAKEEV